MPGPQLDLWGLRWAGAQARVAARRGNARVAREQIAIFKSLLDKGTNPDQQPQYRSLVGYVDFYSKDFRGAVAELQKADQDDPFVLALLAEAYEKIGDKPKALECEQRVLTSIRTPNNAFAGRVRRSCAPATGHHVTAYLFRRVRSSCSQLQSKRVNLIVKLRLTNAGYPRARVSRPSL